MYILGIPERQYRRCTQVLGPEAADPIDYDAVKQDDGFYLFQFPGVDEYGFREIVNLLKANGITTIGADTQLTERKIMKLSSLIKEQGSPDENELIDILKDVLERWEKPDYKGGGLEKCERSDHYYLDIEDVITDYEENIYLDMPDTSNLNEASEEKVQIEIPGIEGKTEVKITQTHTPSIPMNDSALQGITIEFNDKVYSDLDFEYYDDTGNDHGNEGKDVIFAAEGDGMTFEVIVQVEASYEESGNIQAIDWSTLEVTFDEEKSIEEGTCGYGKNGIPGKTPGGIKGMDAQARTNQMRNRNLNESTNLMKTLQKRAGIIK